MQLKAESRQIRKFTIPKKSEVAIKVEGDNAWYECTAVAVVF